MAEVPTMSFHVSFPLVAGSWQHAVLRLLRLGLDTLRRPFALCRYCVLAGTAALLTEALEAGGYT